jgi:hypothetical protein
MPRDAPVTIAVLGHRNFESTTANRSCDMDNISVNRAVARRRTNSAIFAARNPSPRLHETACLISDVQVPVMSGLEL